MKNILIVDDEVSLRALLSSIFSSDYKVFTAEDKISALDVISKEDIDLILLDMRLKNVDGLEILQNIRVINKNVKVYILTAFVDPNKESKLRNLGIEDILQKPFDIFELKKKVDDVLN